MNDGGEHGARYFGTEDIFGEQDKKRKNNLRHLREEICSID